MSDDKFNDNGWIWPTSEETTAYFENPLRIDGHGIIGMLWVDTGVTYYIDGEEVGTGHVVLKDGTVTFVQDEPKEDIMDITRRMVG